MKKIVKKIVKNLIMWYDINRVQMFKNKQINIWRYKNEKQGLEKNFKYNAYNNVNCN